MTLTASEKPSLRHWRTYVTDLWSRRDFAAFLIQGNLASRNASTALGLMWWILNPLISAGIYFVVFGLILEGRRAQENFLTYLVVGVFAFQFTAMSMNGGANLVKQNARLLANVRFPRLILPMVGVAESFVGYIVSLSAVFIVSLTTSIVPSIDLLWLVPVLLIHTVFNLGLSALTARWVVPIRDLGNLIPHLTRFWFYLTPIIWGLSFLEGKPDWAVNLIRANPMYSIVQLYRVAFMHFPLELSDLTNALAWAGAVAILGVATFVRNEGTMVHHL
jgi:teichoic acid transport system permease protein